MHFPVDDDLPGYGVFSFARMSAFARIDETCVGKDNIIAPHAVDILSQKTRWIVTSNRKSTSEGNLAQHFTFPVM